ncbi:MAG: P1 family peptidase [Deltaproteobacteria bacterium]|nr:P1 family peptidase [Deltaproteobacteria bacterium]
MTAPRPHSQPRSNEPRVRARDLGLDLGRFKPGRWNAITDVEGVQVGHSTIIRGAGPLKRGKGPVRTGVTAILPNEKNIFEQRVVGGGFVLNGAGEVSGFTQLMEWGLIETPIFLTNTLSVGQVSDAAVQWMVERFPGIGAEHDVLIPLVGECDDSWLNDAAGRHVHANNVFEALSTAASGPVPEGSVGGGTGMICCDFKSGIGTSSRKLPDSLGGFTVGVLVMNNFGRRRDLRVGGFPIGPLLEARYQKIASRVNNYGSIIAVVAPDAPLSTHQLGRISKRVALGVGRAGSIAAHGSGEIILAFSTANTVPRESQKMIYRMKMLLDPRLDPLYEAAIEATEEAILNSMCMARDMEGANGNFAPALPLDFVKEMVARWADRAPAQGQVEPPRAKTSGVKELADEPTVAEAMPSAVRGAEGMMTIPITTDETD